MAEVPPGQEPLPPRPDVAANPPPSTIRAADTPAGPSIRLSPEEYRDWVHERVARGVMVKLGTILGAIGITGLLTLVALGQREVETQVTKSVQPGLKEGIKDFKAELQELSKEIRERLKTSSDSVNEKIRGEVSNSLLRESAIHERLKKDAEKVIEGETERIRGIAEKAVTTAVRTEVRPDRIREVAERAVDAEVRKAGGLDATLIRKLRPVAVGDPPVPLTQREQALRLLTIFATEDRALRGDLLRVLSERVAGDRELRRIALQAFRPLNEAKPDAEAINVVLTGIKEGRDLESLQPDYVAFLSRFGGEHARAIAALVAAPFSGDAVPTVVADALALMSGAQPVDELVTMAQSSSETVKRAAWRGLARLDRTRAWPSDSDRREALRQLWDMLPDRVTRQPLPASTDLSEHLERLIRATLDNDRPMLARLRVEARLLAIPRLDFIHRAIADEDRSIVDAIRRDPRGLRSYIERDAQEGAERDTLISAMSNLLRLEDWERLLQMRLTRDGMEPATREIADILIAAWTRRLDHELRRNKSAAETRLAGTVTALSKLPDCLYYPGSTEALQLGFRHAPRHTVVEVTRRVKMLSRADTRRPFRGQQLLTAVLEGYVTEPGAAEHLRRLMDEVPQEREKFADLADVFGGFGDVRFRQKDWAMATVAYSAAIRLRGNHPGYLLGRSRARLHLKQLEESRKDLIEAIGLKADFGNDTALDYVRLGDEDMARRAVEQSVAKKETDRERAGALENLGLYYIRVGDFRKAFDLTGQVLRLNQDQSWNWLVRAIAAWNLQLKDDEQKAAEGWHRTKRSNDVPELQAIIKKQMDAYFERPTE